MSETQSKSAPVTESTSRPYGIVSAVLALLLLVVGFLYMQARGQLDDLRQERDELALAKTALEKELAELRQNQYDPGELQRLRQQLETERTDAERARAQAEEAIAQARDACKTGDAPAPTIPPPRTGDCPAQKQCPVCPGDDACQAALKRERELRLACEKELNSEIRDTLR